MTSEATAYVWVWLPGASEPVVAGWLDAVGAHHQFTYGASYLARRDAIALYTPELPLRRGPQMPVGDLDMPGCLADAGPDSWGRRVILARHVGHLDRNAETADLSDLTYLLESSSDRIGALGFQASPSQYVPRVTSSATLADIQDAADRPPARCYHRTWRRHCSGARPSGARPKATITEGERAWIAKFSTASDTYPRGEG